MTVPMSVWAVVPAGGSGNRFTAAEDKLMVPLAGQPVLAHTLSALAASHRVTGIVLVAHPDRMADYEALIQGMSLRVPHQVVAGGATRRASVYEGLRALPADVEMVAIHDAARPLIAKETIDTAIQALHGADDSVKGALVACPVRDTIKTVREDVVQGTVDRSQLWAAQTPQVFWRKAIQQAHEAVPAETVVTDDVQLLELARLGKTAVVTGSPQNIKVTVPADVAVAEALIRARAVHV